MCFMSEGLLKEVSRITIFFSIVLSSLFDRLINYTAIIHNKSSAIIRWMQYLLALKWQIHCFYKIIQVHNK